VVCRQRRYALLAARPVCAASGGPVSAPLVRRRGGLPPPQAGLPGHIRRVGGRTPDTPAEERSAALRIRWVAMLGLQAPPSPCAPCAPRPLRLWPPAPPRAVAVLAFSRKRLPCAARGARAPVRPQGLPGGSKPQPGQAESQCSRGAGSMRSRPRPARRSGWRQRQPCPRPPRCWRSSCHLAGKPGWARGQRASVTLPLVAAASLAWWRLG